MIKEGVELKESLTIIEDVQNRIKKTGVRGLDFQKAKELGVFERISNVLCAVHATVVAAFRIYGDIDYMISEYGGRKNEIARAMNEYEKSFDKFFRFWTEFYASKDSSMDMIEDSESLYHRIMEWADLPETWELGGEQRLKRKNFAIKIETDGDVLYFHKGVAESEPIGDVDESWCVTKFDRMEHKQTTIHTDMDKASALMAAKRLSADDTKNIYTASILRKAVERKETIIPFKAFKANQTIGKIKKADM